VEPGAPYVYRWHARAGPSYVDSFHIRDQYSNVKLVQAKPQSSLIYFVDTGESSRHLGESAMTCRWRGWAAKNSACFVRNADSIAQSSQRKVRFPPFFPMSSPTLRKLKFFAEPHLPGRGPAKRLSRRCVQLLFLS